MHRLYRAQSAGTMTERSEIHHLWTSAKRECQLIITSAASAKREERAFPRVSTRHRYINYMYLLTFNVCTIHQNFTNTFRRSFNVRGFF